MWKTVQLFYQTLPRYNRLSKLPHVRKYLNSAFNSEEAWSKRLESPYIKKINVSNMFYELENQFLHFGKANGIDMDLFTNAVTDASHLDEIEDLIHKLRLSPEATGLLPSTQHAFIRIMMSCGSIEELLRILDDRLNYGIFMDDYSCILLMNKSLKDKNFRDAARVATIQMLQEDFSNPIIKFMSLFSCHKYLLDPVDWAPEQPKPEEPEKRDDDDEEEEIRLRVRYIRNPYFDDHFDLKKPSHLIGKTFWMIGNETPGILGRSYSLIGYALHEKWDKMKNFIHELLQHKEKPVVYKECINFVHKILDDLTCEKTDEFIKFKEEITGLLTKLENSDLLSNDDFLGATETKMKESIKEFEAQTIKDQIKKYEEWENQRRELVDKHIEQLKHEKALSEIEAAKEELKEKEKELFFFENEDKLDIMIDNKRVRYPKKWLGKKKQKRVVDTEYIPPEIEKRRKN